MYLQTFVSLIYCNTNADDDDDDDDNEDVDVKTYSILTDIKYMSVQKFHKSGSYSMNILHHVKP